MKLFVRKQITLNKKFSTSIQPLTVSYLQLSTDFFFFDLTNCRDALTGLIKKMKWSNVSHHHKTKLFNQATPVLKSITSISL